MDEESDEEAQLTVHDMAVEYFRYDYGQMGLDDSFGASEVTIEDRDGRWRVELPRVALVGTGAKPDGKI